MVHNYKETIWSKLPDGDDEDHLRLINKIRKELIFRWIEENYIVSYGEGFDGYNLQDITLLRFGAINYLFGKLMSLDHILFLGRYDKTHFNADNWMGNGQ